VVIVGAGPGGASAAYHLLLASDLKVALVERLQEDRFAHYHRMCGEGISQAGLGEIGLPGEGLVEQPINTVEEHWPRDIDVKIKVRGAIIDRVALLERLKSRFREMGGTMIEDGVTHVTGNGPGMEVSLASGGAITADHIIGADGARSKLRAKFFPELVPKLIWADQFITDQGTERGVLHFHYDQRYVGGYKWVFPAHEGSRIGFPRGTEQTPSGVMERHRRAIPIARPERVVNGRVCLVGDAACQVNSISFGGIRTAIAAGRMAANALAKNDLGRYQREWSSSPFAKASDIDTYRRLSSMSNEELARVARPFRKGYVGFDAMMTMVFSRDRALYLAFRAAGNYGW
jgi:digeranylgeranylglycerophospholipid reductase